MGLNKDIRILETQRNLTTAAGSFTFTATPADNRRLRLHSCAIWYVLVENIVNAPVVTVSINNRLFIGTVQPGTKSFVCIAQPADSSEGGRTAYAVGFSLTSDGEYLNTHASKGRIHGGYEIVVTMTGASAEADISIEAHYGKESGG